MLTQPTAETAGIGPGDAGISRRSGPRAGSASTRRRRLKNHLVGYGLLVPAGSVFVLFFYLPAAYLFYLAFYHWSVLSPIAHFVGFKNFVTLVHQPLFWRSLENSAYYTVVMIPATTFLALGIAMLLRDGLTARRGGIWRAAVFLPHVTPVVATSIIWVWIFNPHFGLANAILGFVHLPQLGWLESTRWALPAVMIDSLWHSLGLYVIIFLAGLSRVPRELIEVASLEGAGGARIFRRIIWPLISPTTFFVVVLASVNTWQAFSQIYTMTGGSHGGAGGPAFATTTDALLVFQTAFTYFHFSLAAAMSLVLFLIILTLTIVQKWISDRIVFYR
ncbi:MAG: sugar ABC transporter permease [Nitrospiraceae bacterium]|nr:sugar ABC transporter permease [Nitrospiraceae bacterium]